MTKTKNGYLAYGVPNGTSDINGVPVNGTAKGQKQRCKKTPRNARRGTKR